MAIRIPTNIATFNDDTEVGAGSVAGMVQHPFQLPLDTDNVVVKFTASVAGAGVSATFQTSDDGGTTYYDVARTSIVSNANNTTAQWLSIPVIGYGVRSSSVVATGSVISGGAIGSAAASTLSAGATSGLPILGIQNRVGITITGNVTVAASNSIRTTIEANNVSASHN